MLHIIPQRDLKKKRELTAIKQERRKIVVNAFHVDEAMHISQQHPEWAHSYKTG